MRTTGTSGIASQSAPSLTLLASQGTRPTGGDSSNIWATGSSDLALSSPIAFAPGAPVRVRRVVVWISNGADLPGNSTIAVELWNLSAGVPTTLVATSKTVLVSSLKATFAEALDAPTAFDFASPVPLGLGDEVGIVLITSTPNAGSIASIWWADGTTPGTPTKSTNPPAVWSATGSAVIPSAQIWGNN